MLSWSSGRSWLRDSNSWSLHGGANPFLFHHFRAIGVQCVNKIEGNASMRSAGLLFFCKDSMECSLIIRKRRNLGTICFTLIRSWVTKSCKKKKDANLFTNRVYGGPQFLNKQTSTSCLMNVQFGVFIFRCIICT